jgi:DNA-binding MarR family transcriptional regulator
VWKVGSRHIESLGLTPTRFEVLSALGDTDGMTVKELGDQALVSKGNLLHVLGSLEEKGLVQRTKSTQDCRQTIVSLTPEGQALYQQTFLVHVEKMRAYFGQLEPDEEKTLIRILSKLKGIFSQAQP